MSGYVVSRFVSYTSEAAFDRCEEKLSAATTKGATYFVGMSLFRLYFLPSKSAVTRRKYVSLKLVFYSLLSAFRGSLNGAVEVDLRYSGVQWEGICPQN